MKSKFFSIIYKVELVKAKHNPISDLPKQGISATEEIPLVSFGSNKLVTEFLSFRFY